MSPPESVREDYLLHFTDDNLAFESCTLGVE